LKLPTLRNCPECSDRYFEYRQETANCRPVHERIGRIHPSEDRRQKIEIIDHPRKRQADLRWANQEEDEDEYAMVPAWPKKESEKEGSALEKPRTEVGGDPDKAGVASKG
jgi:predicted  nucleic acid-binding Zn-ribbon protein